MRKIKQAFLILTLFSSVAMWVGYAVDYTSVFVGKQLALIVVWWKQSEELLSTEIWLAIEEDRLDDASTLIYAAK